MTFEEWRATGRDVADLREHEDETGEAWEDYADAVPGRIYKPGWMQRNGETWWFPISNWDGSFSDLAEAERALWDGYAKAESKYK